MSWHTRRVYALEEGFTFEARRLTLPQARRKLRDVWEKNAPKAWRSKPPELEYGKALILAGKHYSFSEGRSRIVLCPPHRDLVTLLHETAHTLLPTSNQAHGPRFVGTYFGLLIDEGLTTLEELAVAATKHRFDQRWINHV